MASKQVDAISSFQNVVDNVPQWKTQISELATYAAGRHNDFIEEYSRVVQHAKARRRKSASVTSVRTSDAQQELPEPEQSLKSPRSSELAEINPLEAGTRFIYSQAHRKRKPGTLMKSNASGPRAYRSKHMVVIYYDSHIQSELDKLVKSFGVARNTLRKGKNAYTAAKGFSLPSLGRTYQNLDNLVPNTIYKSHPRLPKASSETSVISTSNAGNNEEFFAKTDKELEKVQALCETAAHQVIRDGDCKPELQEASSKLEVLLAMAESTLDRLKAEKQQKHEEEAQAEEEAAGSDAISSQSTLCEKTSVEAFSRAHKNLPPVIESIEVLKRPPLPMVTSAPCLPLSTDTIEVDDDDDDSSVEIDLNITSYRAADRRLVV